MSRLSTPPLPRGRKLDEIFTPTPPSEKRDLLDHFTPTPASNIRSSTNPLVTPASSNLHSSMTLSEMPDQDLLQPNTFSAPSKRRASEALDEEPAKKRDFIERPQDYVSPLKQLVPLVSRAEGAAARMSKDVDGDNGSDSGDDVFEDASESFEEQQGVAKQNDLEEAQVSSRLGDQTMGNAWGFDGVDSNNTNKDTSHQAADFLALGIPGQQVETTNETDDTIEEEEEEEGLHAKYFKHKETTSEEAGKDDDDSIIFLDETKPRITTPPLPTTKSTPTKRKRKDRKVAPRLRPGPDTTLDISPLLLAHARFHFRAFDLIPRLANHPLALNMPARRYWIAVLLPGKKPKNVTSEKDFMWMKGNKFSTVKTVWKTYLMTAMAEEDEAVLMLGVERVEMGTTMEELNYWVDNLVVFRVVSAIGVDGRKNPEIEGRSMVEGLEKWPVEVIELDDD